MNLSVSNKSSDLIVKSKNKNWPSTIMFSASVSIITIVRNYYYYFFEVDQLDRPFLPPLSSPLSLPPFPSPFPFPPFPSPFPFGNDTFISKRVNWWTYKKMSVNWWRKRDNWWHMKQKNMGWMHAKKRE